MLTVGVEPVIHILNGPYLINEGESLTVRLWVEVESDLVGQPLASVTLDLNDDGDNEFTSTTVVGKAGTFDPDAPGADVVEVTFSWLDLVGADVNDGQGTGFGAIAYALRARATDSEGDIGTNTTDIQVANVEPVIATFTAEVVGGGGGGCGGGSSDVSIAATIFEPGPAGELGELSGVVDWDDGNVETVALVLVAPGQYAIAAADSTHTYTTAGDYHITITVTDPDPILDDDGISSGTAFDDISVTGGPSGPSVCLDGGVLTVIGSAGNDNVTITQPDGQVRVQSSFFPTSDFPAGNVQSVVVLLGDGNDMLLVTANKPIVAVGGAGTDILTGGPARSILIGGEGTDLLYGGSSQDILVDGRINNDDNAAALLSLLAEWNSGHTFQQRVRNLIDGSGGVPGLNGTNYLAPAGNDGAIDILIGGGSTDWILRHAGDLNLGLFDFVT